jgi:hypothetical protein
VRVFVRNVLLVGRNATKEKYGRQQNGMLLEMCFTETHVKDFESARNVSTDVFERTLTKQASKKCM